MKQSQTTQCAFYSTNPEGKNLFATQPGINVVDALQEVGNLLSAATEIIYKSEPANMEIYGVVYLVEFAKGTIDACVGGLMKGVQS